MSNKVRMPPGNRFSTSATLQTNDIWSKVSVDAIFNIVLDCKSLIQTIGHDPYANPDNINIAAAIDDEQSKGLLLLARLKNVNNGIMMLLILLASIKRLCLVLGNDTRGGCGKCGMLGHLTFQCRNQPVKREAELSDVSSMYLSIFILISTNIECRLQAIAQVTTKMNT